MNAILLGELLEAWDENALEFSESRTGNEILIPKPLRIFLREIDSDIIFLLCFCYLIINYNYR